MFLFGNKTKSLNVDETYNESKLSGNILIDVREISEYRSVHAEGAINMPLSTLDENDSDALKKYDNVYVICQSGGRSLRAVSLLSKNGVNAVNVLGGTSAWISNGLPTK